MRVCIVFDCLYPYTVGGAERWYRTLSERLAEAGHDVTYLTMRQWPRGETVSVPGVEVIPVAPRMQLYTHGRRSVRAQSAFAGGVLRHLVQSGRRYDAVHTPALHLSALATTAPRGIARYRIAVDWFEVWTPEYWRDYVGPVFGRIAWAGQLLSMRTPQHAFCFSRLHERRLRELGFEHELTRLEGLYGGPSVAAQPQEPEPLIVFAGRHIPEKQVTALVPALARARERIPGLRAEIYGDGPERSKLLRLIEQEGLSAAAEAPGFVPEERVRDALRRALCHVLPSRREGYGLVVIDAAAQATPTVVVQALDNAAVELVEEGVNGVVAASASRDDLASAIERIHSAGFALRRSTADWFGRNAGRLSIDSSLDAVVAAYKR
jgi:glycosyltransferase involved in cell wall biosynthesis